MGRLRTNHSVGPFHSNTIIMSFKTKKQTNATKVEVVTETPDLSIVPRVDGPDILATFESKVAEFKDRALTLTVTSEDQLEEMQEAKRIRLTLRDIRTAAERKRVELVGAAKKELAKIDSEFKDFKDKLQTMEDRLAHQEKFLEYKEAARRVEVRIEREKAVLYFGELNPSIDLANMTDEDFEKYLADCEAARDFRLAEEKRKADEIIANDKERERLRIENEKLQAEQEEKSRKIREMEDERKTREAEEAKVQWEKEQEEKRIAELGRKAKNAPDKDKLIAFSSTVSRLITPECNTEDGIRIAADVHAKCQSFAAWILRQIEEL